MPVGRDVQSFRAFVATWNVGGNLPIVALIWTIFFRLIIHQTYLIWADFNKIGQGRFGIVYYAKLTSEDDTKIVTASGDQTVSVHFNFPDPWCFGFAERSSEKLKLTNQD